jgi:hypothetical protein
MREGNVDSGSHKEPSHFTGHVCQGSITGSRETERVGACLCVYVCVCVRVCAFCVCMCMRVRVCRYVYKLVYVCLYTITLLQTYQVFYFATDGQHQLAGAANLPGILVL